MASVGPAAGLGASTATAPPASCATRGRWLAAISAWLKNAISRSLENGSPVSFGVSALRRLVSKFLSARRRRRNAPAASARAPSRRGRRAAPPHRTSQMLELVATDGHALEEDEHSGAAPRPRYSGGRHEPAPLRAACAMTAWVSCLCRPRSEHHRSGTGHRPRHDQNRALDFYAGKLGVALPPRDVSSAHRTHKWF